MNAFSKTLTPVLIVVFSLIGQLANAACENNTPTQPVGILPALVSGNPELCAGGFRIDPPTPGTYNIDAFGNTVTIQIVNGPCGQVVTWQSSPLVVVDQVIVKGGPNANRYDYTGQNPRPSSDGALHSPLVASGFYADVSHVDFCFHYRLSVSKTAETRFTRTYDWCIEKFCNGPQTLNLSEGQSYNYPFSWTAQVCGQTDNNWAVVGTISVSNPTPFAATLTGISDILSGGIPGVLDCGIAFPYVLASGASLNCTYQANLPSAASGTNTVTVTTSTPQVAGNTATANFAFSSPSNEVDDCITVSDDCQGTVDVCLEDSPRTANYTCAVGPYSGCTSTTYVNTASFVTEDQGITGSAGCSVQILVACETQGGCTLTPGYWKTHSEFGPAPYDNTWAQLPGGASTPFFLSGKTYYQALWTAPAGNAYYVLAHAWIAAYLNQLNGASIPSAVLAAFNSASALFNTYTPAQVAAMKGSSPVRQQFITLGGVLDGYNNGLTGPGHCSEESSSGSNLSVSPMISGSVVAESMPQVETEITAFPNPFSESLEFQFMVPGTSRADLRILDASGRQIAILFSGQAEGGVTQHVKYDATRLPAGLYFYQLVTDQEVKAGQILGVK